MELLQQPSNCAFTRLSKFENKMLDCKHPHHVWLNRISSIYQLKRAFQQREHTMSSRFEDEENKLKASCKHHWSCSTQWSQWWSIGGCVAESCRLIDRLCPACLTHPCTLHWCNPVRPGFCSKWKCIGLYVVVSCWLSRVLHSLSRQTGFGPA